MHRYKIELRDNNGTTRIVHIVADNHNLARIEAENRYQLLVLSTEFLE